MSNNPTPKTYCNPLPLENFQRGVNRKCENGYSTWFRAAGRPGEQQDFREMADPSVIKWQGRWYLFASRGMLWHSDDMVNWQFHAFEPFVTADGRLFPEIGYAPTVVEWNGYILLTACWTGELWRARSPFGPWESMGQIRDENDKHFVWTDPMLFVDDDGALYCYNGIGEDGIYMVKMRDDDPARFDGPRVNCFGYNPEHKWEWFGEHNQDRNQSYIEGAWMFKHKGVYYLTYSGPATEGKNYAMGCYKAKSVHGPWEYQKHNPFLIHRGGLVNGCGHGSIVEGPGDTIWCFYTTSVRIEHNYERRIGMDPVGFDENGDIYVNGPSETPQLAPGLKADPYVNNDAGLVNVSAGCLTFASSVAPGRDPMYATDDIIRTWWEAADAAPQWLTVDLDPNRHRTYPISAARVMFADRGLDYDGGVLPGPYRYQIEGSLDGETWFLLDDQSANTKDCHIAYHTFPAKDARLVRLMILEAPKGMRIGVWEFTVFGAV